MPDSKRFQVSCHGEVSVKSTTLDGLIATFNDDATSHRSPNMKMIGREKELISSLDVGDHYDGLGCEERITRIA